MRSPIGHASVQQTQRYLNVTDEEVRKGLEVVGSGERSRQSEEATMRDGVQVLARAATRQCHAIDLSRVAAT
jgi:hypothetical protein